MQIRNTNGFIEINKLLTKEEIENFEKQKKLVINNYIFFYKEENKISFVYNELIAEEIAKDFNIPCAHYDIAIYNDKKGVISKNIYKKNDSHKTFEEILCEYFNDDNLCQYNNLEDLWDVFLFRYKNNEIVKRLIEQLVDVFIFDVLIGNPDRHIKNLEIIENKKDIRIAPIFDNMLMLSSHSIKYGYYSLGITRDDYNMQLEDDYSNLLEKFLNISIFEYQELLKEKLWIISPENIDKIFKRIETRTESIIPKYVKEFISKQFEYNNIIIRRILEKNQKKIMKVE